MSYESCLRCRGLVSHDRNDRYNRYNYMETRLNADGDDNDDDDDNSISGSMLFVLVINRLHTLFIKEKK